MGVRVPLLLLALSLSLGLASASGCSSAVGFFMKYEGTIQDVLNRQAVSTGSTTDLLLPHKFIMSKKSLRNRDGPLYKAVTELARELDHSFERWKGYSHKCDVSRSSIHSDTINWDGDSLYSTSTVPHTYESNQDDQLYMAKRGCLTGLLCESKRRDQCGHLYVQYSSIVAEEAEERGSWKAVDAYFQKMARLQLRADLSYQAATVADHKKIKDSIMELQGQAETIYGQLKECPPFSS